MKTYLFGFLAILCANVYLLTGCASKHPQPLAATTYRTAIPQKRPLPPVRPQYRRPVVRAVKAVPVVHDTVVKTVYLPAKITAKKPKRHCKVWE